MESETSVYPCKVTRVTDVRAPLVILCTGSQKIHKKAPKKFLQGCNLERITRIRYDLEAW
jgi:hypothetical protein